MTVKELRANLSKFKDNEEIYTWNDEYMVPLKIWEISKKDNKIIID